jgi:hypothetical protein
MSELGPGNRLVRLPIVRTWDPGDYSRRAGLFFEAPEAADHEFLNNKSTLRLLRREIQMCFFDAGVRSEAEAVASAEGSERRVFATASLCMTGLDLLAKFWAGDDGAGRNKQMPRFTAFSRRYIAQGGSLLSTDQAQGLYFARSAMVHSFGPFHRGEDRLSFHVSHPARETALTVTKSRTPDGKRDKLYTLYIRGLYAAFVGSIARYREDLERDSELQHRFQMMYPRYGSVTYVEYEDTTLQAIQGLERAHETPEK